MIGIDADTGVILENLKNIDKALSTGTAAQNRLRKVIRSVLSDVRVQVVAAAPLKRGPREARRAVRTTVYKAILGGNVNIYNSRKAHGRTSYVPARHPSHIGGNRRKRSERTMQIDSYEGVDRGFILRFLNAGTVERETRYGSRGALRARHWFGTSSAFQMDAAASRVAEEIEKLLQQEFQLM